MFSFTVAMRIIIGMDKVESVFKNKNYVLTFLGAFVSNIAALLLNFATSYYILDITDNNAFLQGMYLFACGITFVLVSLFSGVLSDRFNKAKIMYLCDYAKGAVIVGGGFLLLAFQGNNSVQLVLLFILAVLYNIIAAIFSPASQSLLPFILKEEQLQQGNALLTGMNAFVTILGAVLGAVLYSMLPIYVLMFIIGGCYVGSAISEMFIRYIEEKKEDKLTIKVVFNELGESFRYLLNKRAIAMFCLIALFVNFFFTPLSSNFIPIFVKTDVAECPDYLFNILLTPEMWAAVISICICVGSIIGALALSFRKQMDKVSGFMKKQFVILAFLIVGASLSYFFLVDRSDNVNVFLIIFCVCTLLMGIVISLVNVPLGTVLARQVDKNMLGKVQSLINIGSQGLIPIASVLGGVVIEYIGKSELLFMCSGGFILITIVFVLNRTVNEL